MSKKKIGKGLSALLNNIEDTTLPNLSPINPSEEGEKIYELELKKIKINPNQPRKNFGIDELNELAQSITEFGVLQPLILRKVGDTFTIVAGERRYRASKIAGLDKVPVIVKELDEKRAKEISLVENLQREDLNAIEEAEALKELVEMYNLTQAELADRVGKARPSVANSMRLLALFKQVKDMVRDGVLSAGHARCLISVQDEHSQLELALKVVQAGLSVRATEKMVKLHLNPDLQKKLLTEEEKKKITSEMQSLLDDMKRVFATRVSVVGTHSKGRISIDYFSKDDLARIYDLIEKLKTTTL